MLRDLKSQLFNTLGDKPFDEDSQALFTVDNLQLRAEAIQSWILPRMHLLINYATALVREIYAIDALYNSHVSQSPNFRRKREQEITVDYQWVTVGLTGKRGKANWPGFLRSNGKPVTILPFLFEFGLTPGDMGIRLKNYWLTGLSDKSYTKLLQFHLDYADLIHSICFQTGILPLLHWGEGCEPFSSFTHHYQWMIDNRRFDNDFYLKYVSFPIYIDDVVDLIHRYAAFFPIYDSYIQIARDEQPRLEELIVRLNSWMRTFSSEAYDLTLPRAFEAEPEIRDWATLLAAQHIHPKPSLRWQVLHRDGHRCVACGRRGGDDDVVLHVDHIVPRSKGGKDTLDNLQTLCSLCNLGKGNRDDTDLRRIRE